MERQAQTEPRQPHFDSPCAAEGLTSYRYPSRYGWVMIGAKGHSDALNEAARSIYGQPDLSLLQIWNGVEYRDLDWEAQS
jgi:hypothetical protein